MTDISRRAALVGSGACAVAATMPIYSDAAELDFGDGMAKSIVYPITIQFQVLVEDACRWEAGDWVTDSRYGACRIVEVGPILPGGQGRLLLEEYTHTWTPVEMDRLNQCHEFKESFIGL